MANPKLLVGSNLSPSTRAIDDCLDNLQARQIESLNVLREFGFDEDVLVANHQRRQIAFFHDLESAVRQLIQPRMQFLAGHVIRQFHSGNITTTMSRAARR